MQVDVDRVSRALRAARGRGLTLKQLQSQLHLGRQERQPLRTALSALVSQGEATFDGERYRVRTGAPSAQRNGRGEHHEHTPRRDGRGPQRSRSHDLVGTLTLKPEGYGFVAPLAGGGRDADVF